jgi:hypothetical protein
MNHLGPTRELAIVAGNKAEYICGRGNRCEAWLSGPGSSAGIRARSFAQNQRKKQRREKKKRDDSYSHGDPFCFSRVKKEV